MTKETAERIEKYPLYSQDGKGFSAECVIKFFNPCGAGTWYITEGEKQDGDWLFFGYVTGLGEYEWGYVCLSQLEEINLPYGLKIERDVYYSGGKTVSELLKLSGR